MTDDELRIIKAMADRLAYSDDALTHLTCLETDAIVRVVRLGGYSDEAADIVLNHAGGETYGDSGDCDDGDLHAEVHQRRWNARDAGSAFAAARAYVQNLSPDVT